MLELRRKRSPWLKPVDDPWFRSEILVASGDCFELSSEAQQCLKELVLMTVIVGPTGCQYRTWRDVTLGVCRQEDQDIELLRGQSQGLALHRSRAFNRVDNEIADFDRCCRRGSVNVRCRTLAKYFS